MSRNPSRAAGDHDQRTSDTLIEPQSIPDVCEVEWISAASSRPSEAPSILFEVPHGATRRAHYEAVRARLTSELPFGLEQFFFVNTDVGAYECAACAARMIADPSAFPQLESWETGSAEPIDQLSPANVLIVRGLIPRTFIDCNRVIEADPTDLLTSRLTAAIPSYITTERDAETLRKLHSTYVEQARRAFAEVCGNGGLAISLHSYAPRSVGIENVDDRIVENLKRAYEPERYREWPIRPDVDLITGTTDGKCFAPEGLTRGLRARFEAHGFEVVENAIYRLHPGTLGHVHSAGYPGRVLCVELNRARLADPFIPFQELRIGESNVTRMATPLARALLDNGVRRATRD